MVRGRVHASEGGVYQIALEGGEVVEASLRGRLKRQVRTGDKVVIGDEVEVHRDEDGSATIEVVAPRRTQVVRRRARPPRPPAAWPRRPSLPSQAWPWTASTGSTPTRSPT